MSQTQSISLWHPELLPSFMVQLVLYVLHTKLWISLNDDDEPNILIAILEVGTYPMCSTRVLAHFHSAF